MKTETFMAIAIYCEDVRLEAAGTQTFVGVMRGGVNVPAFPAGIPKFAISLEAWVDARRPPIDVPFVVVLTTVSGTETEVTRGILPFAQLVTPNAAAEGRYGSVSAVIGFAPLVISEPCSLFVKCTYEGVEHVPPGLKFVEAPLQQAVTAPA